MNILHRKMKLNQYFQNGEAIIDLLFLQNMPLQVKVKTTFDFVAGGGGGY